MNQRADMLLRNNVQWTMFRGMDAPPARSSDNLGSLWQSSSRPLHLRRQLSLPNLFTKSTDALAHDWPSLPLYTVALVPQVLRRVREQRHKIILIASLWRNQPWVSGVIPAAESSPVAYPLETGPPLSSARYGIHSPSYGPCMSGRSTGAFRPPRACPKHYGRS